MFSNIYKNKKVFITGHTGFKGSWLILFLERLGAEVYGFSAKEHTTPNHFEMVDTTCRTFIGDIRDRESLYNALTMVKPDIVFHLAAQPLVYHSYQNPQETFETNVLGTLNLFEAIRKIPSIKACVNVTSDKCYQNKESGKPFRETDAMGGRDPYSASKGMVELLTNSYRDSFFSKSTLLLASVRAGNVIGGGDWASYRLIPDIVRATANNEVVTIRSPYSIRPWQHVLEPLSGYLLVGEKLLKQEEGSATGWNFGPLVADHKTVLQVLEIMKQQWNAIEYKIDTSAQQFQEAQLLTLDCQKAYNILQWAPIWDCQTSLQKTASWYHNFYTNERVITVQQIDEYIQDALTKGAVWVS